MSPTAITLGILASGIFIVVAGILALRLHPFLALILGALTVGLLTPRDSLERYSLDKGRVKIKSIDTAAETLVLAAGSNQGLRPGMRYLLLDGSIDGAVPHEIANLEVESVTKAESIARIVQVGVPVNSAEGETAFRNTTSAALDRASHTGWIAVHPLAAKSASRFARQNVGNRVAAGFGETCANIGILIALASIVGKCMLDSGAADRIVRFALGLCGERGAPLAFLASGFTLAIPVFFDTVFYLMIPLSKAMALRTNRNYLLYVLTIVAGGTMAHSLVPPTPGPLLVAEQLNVHMGVMILGGIAVGSITSLAGFLFAVVTNRRMQIPLRESEHFSIADLQATMDRDVAELPPVWLSLMPILLPVVLISADATIGLGVSGLPAWIPSFISAVGDKNISMAIAAAISIILVIWKRSPSRSELQASLTSSISGAGDIILITGAGGAFGAVLQQTGVASLIRDLPQSSPAMIILLAWLITAAIRTAQGSATVAMITAVGVLGGLASTLPFHPVYLALAIGCGSKPVSWMNDSGFWVISRMAGLTEAETLRTVTPMTALMGLVGLIVTIIGATFLPFV